MFCKYQFSLVLFPAIMDDCDHNADCSSMQILFERNRNLGLGEGVGESI